MTALPVPDPRRFGAAPRRASHRDERLLLRLAAGAACLLHVAAFFVPFPSRRQPPPEPSVRPMPEITRPDLIPPPIREAPPPRAPMERLLPVPFEAELDEDPVEEPDVRIVEEPAFEAEIDWLPSDLVAPPPPDGVVEEGTEGLIPPVALPGHDPPGYPHPSLVVRQEGRVVLSAVITEQGRVESIEIVRAPRPELGMSRAAIEAVSRWEYIPGMLRGRPVTVRLTVIVDFELD